VGIISIQSQVVAGHVGNSAAVFALNCFGREVWPVPTVLLSHHPGHGGATGGTVPAELLAGLPAGLAARGCFATCEAVLSGYLGTEAGARLVEECLREARAAGASPVYLCDPVLGDDGRTYVRPEIVMKMHNLSTIAGIVTPNAYEIMLLTGAEPRTMAEALQALRVLQARGPGIAVLTSFEAAETPAGTLDIVAVDGAAAWRVRVPKLAQKFSGAGDVFAALFLHFWLDGREARGALANSAAAVQEILLQTVSGGGDELALVTARHQMLWPRQIFAPERLA